MEFEKYDLYRVLHGCNVLRSAKEKAMEETEVLIETSMGDMKVKLYNDTPKHRDNFIKLARAGRTTIFCFIVSYEALWCRPETRPSNPGE